MTGTALTLLAEDGFDGFLTAIFEAFRMHLPEVTVAVASRHVPTLLEECRPVPCDPAKAGRVWAALRKRDAGGAAMVHSAWLAERPEVDAALWSMLRKVFRDHLPLRALFDEDVQTVYQMAWKVRGEAHRFLGYVRFSDAGDGRLFAVIAPDANILPLMGPHFCRRYPRERWLIADSRRGLCLEHGLSEMLWKHFSPAQLPHSASEVRRLASENDARWQELWQTYYRNVNIPQRKNTKLMAEYLPRKVWRYLPERHQPFRSDL